MILARVQLLAILLLTFLVLQLKARLSRPPIPCPAPDSRPTPAPCPAPVCVEELTNDGAIDPLIATSLVSGSNYTLADGTSVGQKKIVAVNRKVVDNFDTLITVSPAVPLLSAYALIDGILYFSVNSTTFAGITTNYIVGFDGTSFFPLGSGLNATANAIIKGEDDINGNTTLYVGGSFSQAGGQPASALARYNTATQQWTQLGGGVNNDDGFGPPVVQSLLYDDTTKYLWVAGSFRFVQGGVSTQSIARLKVDTNNWSATLTNPPVILSSALIYTLARDGTTLYFGGTFFSNNTSIVSSRLSSVSNAFAASPSYAAAIVTGIGSTVYSIQVLNNQLYASGTNMNGLRRFDTSANAWVQVGNLNVSDVVYSFQQLQDGNILVSGNFNVLTNKTSGMCVINPNDNTIQPYITIQNGAYNFIYAFNRLWLKGIFQIANASVIGPQCAIEYVQVIGNWRQGANTFTNMQINGDFAQVTLTWDGTAWAVEESPFVSFLPL